MDSDRDKVIGSKGDSDHDAGNDLNSSSDYITSHSSKLTKGDGDMIQNSPDQASQTISSRSNHAKYKSAHDFNWTNNNNINLKSILIDFLSKFESFESVENSKYDYSKEFSSLKEYSETLKKNRSNFSCGEKNINIRKNRYTDIIPFNHTRVILKEDLNVPGSDYINANFIEGATGSSRAYIACQGPLSNTVIDFWRMIWECEVSIVIMACNEHEFGQSKCEIYWPQQVYTSQIYGNIRVTFIGEKPICPDYSIRKFNVEFIGTHQNKDVTKAIKERLQAFEERAICQIHYTTWPDHGVPNSVQPIIELVKLIREIQPNEDKPIVVHCSAGCGRTGTLCCIDYVFTLLKRGKISQDFDLREIIINMRRQRMAMVQTLNQYILCYRAVATLFVQQLQLLDNHTYENLSSSGEPYPIDCESEADSDIEETNGPVFI